MNYYKEKRLVGKAPMKRILTCLIVSLTLLIAGCGLGLTLLIPGCEEWINEFNTIQLDSVPKLVRRDESTWGEMIFVFYEVDSETNLETPYTGKAIANHPNEQKRWESNFKDGREEGLQVYWYANGQKRSETYYMGGEPCRSSDASVVPDRDWFENGQIKRESFWKNGVEHGVSSVWDENGQKRLEQTIKDGKLDGLRTEWYENGQLEHESNWESGNEIEGTYYHENGQKDFSYIEGTDGRNRQSSEYDESGQIKSVVETLDDGIFLTTTYYENGQPKLESNTKWNVKKEKEEKDGLTTSWHENGQKASERWYKDGTEVTGKSKFWDESGQLKPKPASEK